MTPLSCWAAAVLLAAAGAAQAQVYRCGEERLYTDKPCADATPVDVRANVMDAGPRQAPRDDPRPAIILPDPTWRPLPGTASTLWERRDARESEYRSRTGPSRP